MLNATFANLAGIVSTALGTQIVLSRVPVTAYNTETGAMAEGAKQEQTLSGVWGLANDGEQGKTPGPFGQSGGPSQVRTKSRRFTVAAIDVKWVPELGDTAQIGADFYSVENVEPVHVNQLAVQYTLTLELA